MRLTPPRGYEVFSLMTWSMGDAHRCTRARHGCEERGATARVAVEGSFPFWKPHADNTLTTRTTAMSRGRKHGPSASGGPRVHLNEVFLRSFAAACRLSRPRGLRAASTAPPHPTGTYDDADAFGDAGYDLIAGPRARRARARGRVSPRLVSFLAGSGCHRRVQRPVHVVPGAFFLSTQTLSWSLGFLLSRAAASLWAAPTCARMHSVAAAILAADGCVHMRRSCWRVAFWRRWSRARYTVWRQQRPAARWLRARRSSCWLVALGGLGCIAWRQQYLPRDGGVHSRSS